MRHVREAVSILRSCRLLSTGQGSVTAVLRLLLAVAFSFSLEGCALGPAMIRHDTIEFGEAIEDTTNKLLVMNVLRARDKAPLHFADISVIRESIQQSASFGFLNILGDLRNTTQRDTRSGTLAIQKTPSFDINHLHSKEFITGITSPIDPKIVKYWLDRGLDRRIVLLLFFSAVEIVETHSAKGPVNTIRISNSPRDAAEIIKARRQAFGGADALRCDSQSDFERYLKLLNTLRTFSANTYRERRLLARGLNPGTAEDSKNLQAFAALDQAKVQLVYDRERHTYSVYSLGGEQKVAFCFHDEQQAGASQTSQFEVMDVGEPAAGDKRSCFQSVVEVTADDGARRALNPLRTFFPGPAEVNEPSRYCSVYNRFTGSGVVPAAKPGGYPKLEVKLFIRSVGEIFQFLGDLLHYQDEVRRHLDGNPQLNLKLNSPVTFGYCGDHPEPGCDNIFIRLDGDSCNARFSLAYREREYRVANFNSSSDARCGSDHAARKDHTLEILSVLHQLVGLNKSATDVRTTPTVNVLP